MMLQESFDALAVPLPPSFQQDVEEAIDLLPTPTVVIQTKSDPLGLRDPEEDDFGTVTYVPVDPCQGVIMALRIALGERLPRYFIDLESDEFPSMAAALPDPYALKQIRSDRFAAAMLPVIPRPVHPLHQQRMTNFGQQLRALEKEHQRILCVCSILEWPWIREAYLSASPAGVEQDSEPDCETRVLRPTGETLMFLLGELPFITGLYEQARFGLDDDENLSIDGVKQLLIAARATYRADFKNHARQITPQTLSLCLRYVRNLTLQDRRMTPDLYNLVIAAKQVVSDSYARHVAECARHYPFDVDWDGSAIETVDFGIDRVRLPDGSLPLHQNRLPGSAVHWRSCQLKPRADKEDREKWEMAWNPYSQCSWPPEDNQIEDFRTHVAKRALAAMGVDLAKTEKFTTSLKDGLDIRETLRNWHTGDLYVKEVPAQRGRLDAVLMLFDAPADPRDYPWRTTWFAEHQNESTLAFFATDFRDEIIGPGIGQATYGGTMFLFPPKQIYDIWQDPRLDFAETMEERMLAACCLYSECPQIALLSPLPPGAGWRRLAKRYGKKIVHLPLSSFSQSTIEQMRIVHVLNGHEVRSYAAHFIRKA